MQVIAQAGACNELCDALDQVAAAETSLCNSYVVRDLNLVKFGLIFMGHPVQHDRVEKRDSEQSEYGAGADDGES